MRFSLKNIIWLWIAALMLCFVFYVFVVSINKDTVQLDCYIKSFENADLQMFYNGKTPEFSTDQSNKQPLVSSQFFRSLPFQIPGTAETKFLRLDFGESENTFVINKMVLIVKGVNGRDTLKTWMGNDLRQLVRSVNDAEIETSTVTYLVVKTNKNDPYIVFNDAINNELAAYQQSHGTYSWGAILCAILLSLIVLSALIHLGPKLQIPSFNIFIRQGYGLICGAGFIVFFVFFNNKFEILPDIKSQENRRLSPKPELHMYNVYEYPDMYSIYAKDNFSFRNSLFFLHSFYIAKLFKTSPLPSDVIVGKNGWFFNNEINSINDFRNLSQVSTEELAVMTASMLQKKRWLEKRNIKFYVMVPPNKEMVYAENMPAAFFRTTGIGYNRLDYYKKHLAIYAGINIIDPTQSLIREKAKRDVYYTTDTHWNLFGGFVGYRDLITEIKKDFPLIEPVKEGEFKFDQFYNSEGDLAKLIGLQNVYQRKEYAMSFRDTSEHLSMPQLSDIRIEYRNNKTVDGSQLKLVMFRDSYANYLIPYLNLHFKDAVYLWSYEFMDDVIEKEKPDVVIFESLQRFMPMAFLTANPEAVNKPQ